MNRPGAHVETSNVDPFDPSFTFDPFDQYRAWRDLGHVVRLPNYDIWVIPRYSDVRDALADEIAFSAAKGTGLLEASGASSVISPEPAKHQILRSVLSSKLAPRALASLRHDINEIADAIVANAVERESFDAVTDIAQILPVTIVADLIGLPPDGRDRLLSGADAVNNLFGPWTSEVTARLPEAQDYFTWMSAMCDRDILTPGSWGAAILDTVDDRLITHEEGIWLMNGYLVAGMDTTVNAISSLLHLFATHPNVWAQLRANPSAAQSAFEEIVRLESPIQGFFRTTTRDVSLGDQVLPADARVLLSFGSANHDERHYAEPDRFDLTRNPTDHVGFGYGPHGCAGQALARMEGLALITSLLARVERFELTGEPRRRRHPIVRGLASVPVRAVPFR